jgi:hypothetical protein
MVRVYAPEGVPQKRELALTPLPVGGPALRIGTLNNNKPNAGLLLSATARELATLLGAPGPLYTEKERASMPAPAAVVNQLAAEADLVLVGTAD